jgi:hypothetical protein
MQSKLIDLNSKLYSPLQVLFLTSKSIKLWKDRISLLVAVIPKSRFRNEYTMVATGFSKRPIHNPPYTHPTAVMVARAMAPADSYINSNRPPQNMACRSQLRNGSTKTCRRRGGWTKFSYGSHQQRTLDGSGPFSQYRDCKICKVKQYNADKSESQKKKIPHRGHHPISRTNRGQCSLGWPSPSNAPLPQTSDSITIQLSLYPWPLNQVQNNQVPNPFFIPRTSARQTTTPTPLIANPRAPRADAMDLFQRFSWEAFPSDESTPRAWQKNAAISRGSEIRISKEQEVSSYCWTNDWLSYRSSKG